MSSSLHVGVNNMNYLIKRVLVLPLGLGLGSCPRGACVTEMHMCVFQMTCTKMVIEVIHMIVLKGKLSK